jgi:hypothetical protein
MSNLRRIRLVGAVAMLYGLAALVNAVPPAPYVVIGTDPSAGSSVQASSYVVSNS